MVFQGNRIAVDFEYEYHDKEGKWHRAYGLEHWIFNAEGIMENRETSINEIDIADHERKFK